MNTKKISIIDILMVIAAFVLMIGVQSVFSACEVGEESIMACHWAQQAVFAVSIAEVLISLICLGARNRSARLYLSISNAILSVVVIFIPGTLINLCMMDDMRCRSIMRPAVTITAVVMIVICAVNIFTSIKKDEN